MVAGTVAGVSTETSAKANDRYYNGKEAQDVVGWYDFGARMYNPEIGRWMNVDPMTENQESWSPFHYTYNNPVRFTDPDGREPCCGNVDWGAAGRGFVKGVAVGAVGAIAVTALVASGGTAAPLIGYGLAAYGAYETGKTGYEVVSGKEAYSGRELSNSERSEKGGSLVGGFIGGGLGAKSGLGSKIGSEGPVVYRALAEGENPTQGLSARSPGAKTSPISHVAGKKQSDLISTTKDKAVALEKYNSGNGVVKIRLNKVKTEIIDISGGIEKGGRFSNWAKRDKEVLIRDHIPANAINVIQKPQK